MDRNLRAFLAVVRHGNLTAAADAIGLTQPALTKSIRRLEDSVGGVLFDRSTKGMVLNETGRMFLERARTIETHWSQAREEIDARAGGRLREFRIAAGAAYHMRIAPLLVRQLASEFPETRFGLEFDVAGAMLPPLQNGELHLLLGAFIHQPPEGLVTERLMEVVTGVICDRDHPLTRLERVPPAALDGHKWLIYKRDSFMYQRLATYCLQHRLAAPQVVVEIDAMASGMVLARGTDLLIAAPTTVKPMAEEAGLVVLPLEVPLWHFPSGAWMRRSTREYPILRRALQILRESCGLPPDHS
ncbi:MAG: LysR family transcriptional regulator [Paracoccus sp. (in: a-proteobacteria)]